MTGSGTARYETLCRLAEHELELVGEGDLERLSELHEERAALIDALPPAPPAAARAALERCALLTRRVEIELVRTREALLAELAGVARGQRAASGYKPPNLHSPRVTASA
jgi:hypothetical protein